MEVCDNCKKPVKSLNKISVYVYGIEGAEALSGAYCSVSCLKKKLARI